MIRKTTLIAGGAAAALTAVLAVPAAVSATTLHKIPVVQVHLGKHTTLSRTHLRPGRVTFEVHSTAEHTLQIARLHKGYTLQQADSDIGQGFGGDAAAIRRVDKNVTFYGGSAAKKGKPSAFTIGLNRRAQYLAINFDTGAYKAFTVSGALVHRHNVAYDSNITMLTYGFNSRSHIPRSGVMRLSNVSDQPHFIVLLHVKESTTRAQVKKALKSDSDSKPKFALPGTTDSGTLSPFAAQRFTYRLPAGKYVIACFWPDSKTGMEHAQMGMFNIIHLT